MLHGGDFEGRLTVASQGLVETCTPAQFGHSTSWTREHSQDSRRLHTAIDKVSLCKPGVNKNGQPNSFYDHPGLQYVEYFMPVAHSTILHPALVGALYLEPQQIRRHTCRTHI